MGDSRVVDIAIYPSHLDQFPQLPVEIGLARAPETGIQHAEVAACLVAKPRVLHCAAQKKRRQAGAGQPLADFCLNPLLGVDIAFVQAIQRQAGLVPAAGFHVVHVVAEGPQPKLTFKYSPTGSQHMAYHARPAHGLVGLRGCAQYPAQPMAVADAARLGVQRQPVLAVLVVGRQRMIPSALVVEAVVLGDVLAHESVGRAATQWTDTGLGLLKIEPDTAGHGPEDMGGMHLNRCQLSLFLLQRGDIRKPGKDVVRLRQGALATVIEKCSLLAHVEPQVVPQAARRLAGHQRGQWPATTQPRAVTGTA